MAGHRTGANSHNVSATVSIKDDEWDMVAEWMWKNKEKFNGLSCLPFDDKGHTYVQAPFQTCTKDEYDEMMKSLSIVELTNILEVEDNTTLAEELACGGLLGCEVV